MVFIERWYGSICMLCACPYNVMMLLHVCPQAQEHHTLEIRCKPEYHRFLIGRQGANIRRVRDKFGARVLFPQKSSEEDSEMVMIIGRKEKAEAAKAHLEKLIKELVRFGKG